MGITISALILFIIAAWLARMVAQRYGPFATA